MQAAEQYCFPPCEVGEDSLHPVEWDTPGLCYLPPLQECAETKSSDPNSPYPCFTGEVNGNMVLSHYACPQSLNSESWLKKPPT